MTSVELNDIVVNYSRLGSGKPVVLLHGLAEDHRSWDAVAAHLGSFTTFAVDLRGHGRTTAGQGAGTLSQLSDDLIMFLRAVSGPAAVVGYSLGGTIALRATDRGTSSDPASHRGGHLIGGRGSRSQVFREPRRPDRSRGLGRLCRRSG